jgi:hypothetical protein
MPCFEELYSKVPLFQTCFIPIKCKQLIPDNENWKFTSTIDFEKYKTASERVWSINQWLAKQKCRSYMRFPTGRNVDCPAGLGLIQKLPMKGITRSAISELADLFSDEEKTKDTVAAGKKIGQNKQCLNLLFSTRNVSLPEAIEYMSSEKYHALATFILMYVKAILHLLGGDSSNASTSTFSIAKYAPKVGMKIHMDGVEATDQEFGPALAIPMGPGPKIFDLFPTFIHENATPVRLKSHPFEPIMMQGSSRIEYSHAVPYGQDREHISLIFRFKDFRTSSLPKVIKYNPVIGHAAIAIVPENKTDSKQND